jgi:hypothetical protein
VDYPEYLAGHHEWHAEHRLDPLLPQDGVEHVRVVDVGEDHRFADGCDPACEPAADGDANTSLDFFLDPDRRASDQLVSSLVDEQDGTRVRFEDVADPRQQHGEQVVELEVCEGHVRDGLHVLDPLSGVPLRFECSGVLDADRRSVGSELQQLDIVCVELSVLEHPDMEHPEHLPRGEQRDAEHRFDAFRAQERVQHVRVVDVIEDDGPPVCGHASRKPAAERDANALLDLFFDPHRRPSNQLIRRRVEQQHRARVDAERLARAQEERRQERVELEVRECGIRQRLEPTQACRVLDALRSVLGPRLRCPLVGTHAAG